MNARFSDEQLNENWTKTKKGKNNYKELINVIKKVRKKE